MFKKLIRVQLSNCILPSDLQFTCQSEKNKQTIANASMQHLINILISHRFLIMGKTIAKYYLKKCIHHKSLDSQRGRQVGPSSKETPSTKPLHISGEEKRKKRNKKNRKNSPVREKPYHRPTLKGTLF